MFFKVIALIFLTLRVFAGGIGTAHMNIVVKNFERSEVESLIPKELRLVQYKNTPPDMHPLMFYFSKQRFVTGELKGIRTMPYVGTFNEFAIAIPNVEHIKRPGKVFKYHHIIYLDNLMGILTAKPYKLRKYFMNLKNTNKSFSSSKRSQGIIEANFAMSATRYDSQSLFDLISQDSIAKTLDEKYQCSSIMWEKHDLKNLFFTDVNIQIAKKASPDLFEDISIKYNDLVDDHEGSYFYKNKWILRKISCF